MLNIPWGIYRWLFIRISLMLGWPMRWFVCCQNAKMRKSDLSLPPIHVWLCKCIRRMSKD